MPTTFLHSMAVAFYSVVVLLAVAAILIVIGGVFHPLWAILAAIFIVITLAHYVINNT